MTRLPKLTADGANIISGEHVDRVMIAAAITHEQARQIVLAVNTFDQAREALKGILNRYVSLVESGDAGNWDPHSEDEVKVAKAVLAAMEATHE